MKTLIRQVYRQLEVPVSLYFLKTQDKQSQDTVFLCEKVKWGKWKTFTNIWRNLLSDKFYSNAKINPKTGWKFQEFLYYILCSPCNAIYKNVKISKRDLQTAKNFCVCE